MTDPNAPWHRLEALPRGLWLPGLVTSVGTAARRLEHLGLWRHALLRGELPPGSCDFGDPEALVPLREACARLGLARLCGGAPAMVEQVLRTLLWHLDRIADLQPRLDRTQAIAKVSTDFVDAWRDEAGDWDQLLVLLQGLGDLASLRWDELRGHLQSRDFQEARRIAEHLARLPELAALVRRLGRSHHAPATPPSPAAAPRDLGERHRQGVRVVHTHLPDAPGEWRGIRYSGRLEHMLGSEAAMIRHPVLHKLWRARRAEARLLSYDSQAVLRDLRPDPGAPPRPLATTPAALPLERGPIILCLDTSGSMRGAPENIAKAVALEAVRTAHRERRGCKLIAFGGPDEVVEHDLALSPTGLAHLLALMGQGFDGGTDVQTPIERALGAVRQQAWRSADLLIVSDGEFGCTPATLAGLDQARDELGLRVQGVLVGDRETLGLMQTCDDIFWVRDWRRHGQAGGSGFSPVHSKSLTALYFPNALSGRAALHRPKDGSG